MEVLLDTRVRFLLVMFVLEAAADCPVPVGEETLVLTDDSLLMNAFPDGSVVTFECANGHVIESGTTSITCIDGVWSKSDLICKKRDCGIPEEQPNMSFNTSGGTLFGDKVKVICEKGYRIRGSSYKECFSTGWGRRTRCEIVMCNKPAEVPNGRNSWDSQNKLKYGEVVRYACIEGYTLIGKAVIACGETGEYDSQPPECKETSSSTNSPATSTGHRDKTITNAPISPSARGVTDQTAAGDKDITTTASVTVVTSSFEGLKTVITTKLVTPTPTPSVPGVTDQTAAGDKDITTTASVTVVTSSFEDEFGEAVDANKNIGYIVSVACFLLVVCIIVACVCKCVLRRKGSYDTREDLKPELLQFPNL